MLHRLTLLTSIAFMSLSACMGQQPCGAEVKLLLDPGGARGAAKSLKAAAPASGRVFLYDTDTRDLLAHGIILRVRQGASADLTVKLRLPDARPTWNSRSQAGFKCELDFAGNTLAYSYSVQAKLTTEAPRTGVELHRHLNRTQSQLLRLSGYAIDWSKVTRVADIRSTDWTIPRPPRFNRLSLELWEWSGAAVLELSTKATSAELQTAYTQLRNFATGKGLALNRNQQFKTELVLRR
jgi:hypothetical protein